MNSSGASFLLCLLNDGLVPVSIHHLPLSYGSPVRSFSLEKREISGAYEGKGFQECVLYLESLEHGKYLLGLKRLGPRRETQLVTQVKAEVHQL